MKRCGGNEDTNSYSRYRWQPATRLIQPRGAGAATKLAPEDATVETFELDGIPPFD